MAMQAPSIRRRMTMADRLTELGVKNEAFIPDGPEDEKLPHGFDTLEYEKGYQSMEKMVAFVSGEVFGREKA